EAERHPQQSMVLVPRDAPGVSIRRGMTLFGYDDAPHRRHAERGLSGDRAPPASPIGDGRGGVRDGQARRSPRPLHHRMPLLGRGGRALELRCRRVTQRTAFGRPLAEQGVIQDWIAESRVRIEQARLLVLKTAWLMDTVGNKGAHTEIQAIKVATPA